MLSEWLRQFFGGIILDDLNVAQQHKMHSYEVQ